MTSNLRNYVIVVLAALFGVAALPAAAAISGTLTPAFPSCTIAAGASSCNVSLTWSTTNPVGTSAVTSNYPSRNTTVAEGSSGSINASVPYNTRSFYLYNNGQLLGTSSATSSCTSGTTWNGSTCQGQTPSGTLTPAFPSCSIASGASSCNVSLTWSTTNPVGTSAVTSNYPSPNTTVATGNSGSIFASVPYNNRSFYLYNNAQLLATSSATSSCTSGTTWNGSTCQGQTPSGTLTPASPSCSIAAGASSCTVSLTWSTTNPVGNSAVTSDYPSPNTTVATGNSGSVNASVPYNSRIFYLYNNAQLLATSSATSSCASGTTWNGSTCQGSAIDRK